MKPSEKIKSYISVNDNVNHPVIKNILLSIGAVLDEQAEMVIDVQRNLSQLKYVCPNCHRIVDELIEMYCPDNVRPDGSTIPVEIDEEVKGVKYTKCKYCSGRGIYNIQ